MATFKKVINGIPMLVNDRLKGFVLTDKKSSMITYIGTDLGANELFIQFTKGGGCAIFKEVGETTLDNAMSAPSIGSFYHAEIKGKFESDNLPANCIALDEGEGDGDFSGATEDEDDEFFGEV